jgi:hypothetical protein
MTKARGDQPDKSADLSEAARAAVRDPGDPRIDAHLAALGLGPDPAPQAPEAPTREPAARAEPAAHAEPAAPALPATPATPPEVAALRTRVDDLDAALAAARRQVRWLGVALVVALAASVVLILLLVGRSG